MVRVLCRMSGANMGGSCLVGGEGEGWQDEHGLEESAGGVDLGQRDERCLLKGITEWVVGLMV